MKMTYLTIIVWMLISIFSVAYAVPPGMSVEFVKSPMGKVTLDGKLHADKGIKCDGCHPKIFEQKKGTAQIKLADHSQGKKFCFACHNGKEAFIPENNCNKCHKM